MYELALFPYFWGFNYVTLVTGKNDLSLCKG